ncbi:hypothetical protein M1328_01510 [Patescibacteria group bacterium]|nr:hypothetical protein [Patescibacteria group bacterium]
MENAQTLEQTAINAAINSKWDEAVEANEKIIRHDKKNVDAYQRLGFAYLQKGKIKKAKEIYRIAKKLQPGNYLIDDQLERIKILESKRISKLAPTNLNPYTFIEVPGKTKTINLVNNGQKSILASLSIGQEVILVPKKRRIEIRTENKDYIGCLPDDISKRLTIFMKAGSVFNCFVKEANLKIVTVFLKEDKKGRRVARYASFPISNQANLTNITLSDEEGKEEESEEISDNDLEKLAESLSNEEKEYLPYESEDREESEE